MTPIPPVPQHPAATKPTDEERARQAAAEPALPAAGPVDGDWAEREAAGRDRTGPDEDSALESLGKAVTDPVRTAADETPGTPAPGA